jgi:hypothetical protein
MSTLVGIGGIHADSRGDENAGPGFALLGDGSEKSFAFRVFDHTSYLALFAADAAFRVHKHSLHKLYSISLDRLQRKGQAFFGPVISMPEDLLWG